MRLLLVILLLIISTACSVAAERETSASNSSPDGNYVLKIEARPEAGRDLYLVSSEDAKTRVLLESTDRWMNFRWAPNSQYCVVENHSDGHITSLKIFKIYGRGKDGAIVWEEVYHSPSPQRYDCFWTLLNWNLKSGTVKLHCRYREEEAGVVGTGKWIERDFEVPIDCVPLH
ncbi:MAG TPA: hypothetical protein VK956_13720 [Verrucomicrobium sp.]|nr:hypothetical protein [Verrucomicrobium sp.]